MRTANFLLLPHAARQLLSCANAARGQFEFDTFALKQHYCIEGVLWLPFISNQIKWFITQFVF